MDELDDFQLDEETLKQIEEEARKLAEQELHDTDLLKDIEASALEEAGLDDVDLGEDFMKDLEKELQTVDLDDDDDFLKELEAELAENAEIPSQKTDEKSPESPVKKDAPAEDTPPAEKKKTPPKESSEDAGDAATKEKAKKEAVQKAKKAALHKAKNAAIGKAKKVALSKAKQHATKRAKKVAKRQFAITQAEAETEKTERKTILLVAAAFLVVTVLLFSLISMLENKQNPKPKVKIEKGVQQNVDKQARKDALEADYLAVLKETRRVTKTMSPDNIRKAIKLLEDFKAKEPSYADKCDKKIAAFKRGLSFVSSSSAPPAKTK